MVNDEQREYLEMNITNTFVGDSDVGDNVMLVILW